MDRIVFLMNGTIENGRKIIDDITRHFSDVNSMTIRHSGYAGHLKELATEYVNEGVKYIVAVGGDGSINEIVNGIMLAIKKPGKSGVDAFEWDRLESIRFGVIPAGSGNDFSRTFGWRQSAHRVRNSFNKDKFKKIDVGWTSTHSIEKELIERFFLNVADAGMGGETALHMAKHRIPILGSNINYMKAIGSSFFSYRKSMVRWTTESNSWEGNMMSVVMANGIYFGSGLGIAPNAKQDDGKFSLITLAEINMLDYILNMRKVKECQILDHPKVSYNEFSELRIEALDGKDVSVEMDGDFAGYCPMEVRCIPRVLPVMI